MPRDAALVGQILRGPLAGWIGAARDGHLLDAWPIVTFATAMPLGAWLIADRTSSVVARAFAVMTWYFWGHYFTIGMWI